MSLPRLPLIAVTLLLSATRLAVPRDADALKVTLPYGILEGTYTGAPHAVAAFLGIPYASPPIAGLRWRPPQPPPRWTGVRNATHFAASCSQLRASWLPRLPFSEDCLYLNVWTPKPSAKPHLPVLVWLHGGGNVAGTSQQDPIGPPLARLGLVVVSLNYRLGPFGFLAHPALTRESSHHSSGNYGLLDQLQALRWVRDNIGRFGGDPSQVTLAGQSAGAGDTCLLMASPLAAGLFARAILESGDCQSVLNQDLRVPLPYNSIFGSAEQNGQRLAAALGLPDSPDLLDKLRRTPAAVILSTSNTTPHLAFNAIVDGWVVPRQPAAIFNASAQMHIPVLAGSNSNEASVFGGAPTTIAQYRRVLAEDAGRYADQQFAAYSASSDAAVTTQYLRLQSDEFEYGAYTFARAMSRAGQPAYLYYFTYSAPGQRASLGAFHGEELFFLANSFPDDWLPRPSDNRLAAAIETYWTQFAKTGNPNARHFPNWPAWTSAAPLSLELSEQIHTEPIPHAAQLESLDRIMRQILARFTPPAAQSSDQPATPAAPADTRPAPPRSPSPTSLPRT